MTGIRQAIDDYLAVRRALGYKLEDHGWLLDDFASFMEAAGAVTVTTGLALAWATLPEDTLPSWHAARLRVVRGFARHLQALDPATEVPPVGLLACRNRRAVPYLYCEAEVSALMTATASLRPALHAATHKTLIGLLAAAAARRGDPPGPGRPGRRRGDRDDPGQQVREEQADPAAPEHARRPRRVWAAPRSALSRPQDAEPAGVHCRDPADQPEHPLRLRPAGPPACSPARRHAGPACTASATRWR